MSNNTTTRPNLNAHFAHCNGFDTVHRTGGIYGSTLISPMVKWLMGDEVNLHWLVSDMLVLISPLGIDKLKRSEFLTVKFNHSTGVMSYEDVDDNGRDIVIHKQEYDSHDLTENLKFYVTNHYTSESKICKLVMVSKEY